MQKQQWVMQLELQEMQKVLLTDFQIQLLLDMSEMLQEQYKILKIEFQISLADQNQVQVMLTLMLEISGA
jgi:hypothetical protein